MYMNEQCHQFSWKKEVSYTKCPAAITSKQFAECVAKLLQSLGENLKNKTKRKEEEEEEKQGAEY